MKLHFSLCSLTALTLISSACREKGEVHHHRVEKKPVVESARPGASAITPGAGQITQTPDAAYQWTLPDGWSAQPASGMRLATIVIPSPTVAAAPLNASLTEFGGDLAGNINRWRNQMALPPLPEAELMPSLDKVDTGLGPGYIVTLTNPATPDKAMLAAIVPRPSGTSLFVKVTGTPTDIQSIKTSFQQFTQSLKQ